MINRQNCQPGFSLTELMIYLAIVGALAGGIFAAWSFVGTAKVKTTRNTLRMVKTHIDSYHESVGSLPQSLQDLIERPANAKNWDGPYLDALPLDSWKNELQYEIKGKNKYELYSWGPEGEGSPEEKWIKA